MQTENVIQKNCVYECFALPYPNQSTEGKFDDDEVTERLISEVIRNGYEKDLCTKTTHFEATPPKHSLIATIGTKMKVQRHKEMRSPLNRCELLAILLYTAGKCTYDLAYSQRNGNYQKWFYLDLCFYNAIVKLHKRETGSFPCYSGLKNVRMPSSSTEDTFHLTYQLHTTIEF